jgi:hypothetical protein
MKDDRELEVLLVAALQRKGAPAPFTVDVTRRVMAQVAAVGPPPRTELGPRQAAGWAAAAMVLGGALTAAAATFGPGVSETMSHLGGSLATATAAALKLLTPAGALAGALGRVALALLSSVRALVQMMDPLQPIARIALAATAVAMLSITILVVARDVSARTVEKEHA